MCYYRHNDNNYRYNKIGSQINVQTEHGITDTIYNRAITVHLTWLLTMLKNFFWPEIYAPVAPSAELSLLRSESLLAVCVPFLHLLHELEI